jgi:3',5'-cyclic AMP phosphodiesterase CpdA
VAVVGALGPGRHAVDLMREDERPLRILHLSDTHLMAPGRRHHQSVDTLEATHRVLTACAVLPSPDLVVVSGDVSDDGSPESYEAARTMIGGWAAARGARTVFAMGNHDQRGPFRDALGNGHLAAEAAGAQRGNAGTDQHLDGVRTDRAAAPDAAGATSAGPVYGSSWVGQRRVLTVDSSVPAAGYGRLDQSQIDWLREQLRAPAPAGTVLVIHHPPLPAVTRLHTALRLRGLGPLAQVIRGSDVRVILSGHYHHAMSGTFAGRPVIVAPAVANRTDTLVRPGAERAVRGSAACHVTIGADSLHATVHVAADPRDGDEVFHYGPELVDRIAAAAGPSADPSADR